LPFVDGSIRREPDLEHPFPTITCLCRAGKFAPRLTVGDVVAYLTKKATFGTRSAHRRLVAALRVIEVFDSHAAGATWYRGRNLSPPNNCLVNGNAARPLDHSHRQFQAGDCFGDARTHRTWDAVYRLRARIFGTFVVCEPLFCDLSWASPVVADEQLVEVLGRIPGTLNPGALPLTDFRPLMRTLRIAIRRGV
jgi:hypothetical protein